MIELTDRVDRAQGTTPTPDGVLVCEVDRDGAQQICDVIDREVADEAVGWALLWMAGLTHLWRDRR